MNADTRAGWAFMLAAAGGYTALTPMIKHLYAVSTMEPFHVLTWRYLIAIPMMWLVVRLWDRLGLAKDVPPDATPPPAIHVMAAGLLYGVAVICGFYGLRYLDASVYIALEYSYPVLVVVLMAMMGSPVLVRGWVALGLVMTGVLMIVPDALHASFSPDAWKGVVLALISAMGFALYMIASPRVLRGYPMTVRMAAWNITGLGAFLPVFLLVSGVQLPANLTEWLLIAAMATLSTILPMVGFIFGAAKLGPARASIVSMIELVFSIGLAVVLLGETPSGLQWAGVWAIFASVVILEVPITVPRLRPRRALTAVTRGK